MEYETETGEKYTKSLHILSGIFNAAHGVSAALGKIITTTILMQDATDNYTAPSEEFIASNCGLKNCPNTKYKLTILTLNSPVQK